MPRWEHGSKGRLQKAAIELFDERGFENTSVVEIAERARVTTRTFFRYFPDKREVLFAGADDLRATLVEKILQAPDVSEPLQVVLAVLAGFDWESVGPRAAQRRRQEVIEANPELLERDLIKHHGLAAVLIDALQQRGVDADIAGLATRVGAQIFFTAYRHWLEAGDQSDLATISENVTSSLATILSSSATPAASRQKKARLPADPSGPSSRRRSDDAGATVDGEHTGRPR